MRTPSTLIVLSTALLFACGVDRPGPLVFILAGQSNMVGQGQTSELTEAQRVSPPRVRFHLAGKETRLTGGERFGPEVSLAVELARAMPDRDLILIKHAVGGTSLLAWAPDWDSTRARITGNAGAGPLYSQLMQSIERVPLPPGSEFGGVFWMQGERDSRIPEAGIEYFDNLRVLIGRIRTDLDEPDLPFLLGHVNPPADRYPALDAVRQAQQRAASEIPGVFLIGTEGVSKRDDDLHYDTGGILELGRRFANAWLSASRPGG